MSWIELNWIEKKESSRTSRSLIQIILLLLFFFRCYLGLIINDNNIYYWMQQLSYYYPTDRSYLQQLHLNSIEFISIPNRPKISISALSLSLSLWTLNCSYLLSYQLISILFTRYIYLVLKSQLYHHVFIIIIYN